MARYLCHDEPELLSFETDVLDSRPGAVRLSRSAFYPGGGGQLPDRGSLEWQGGTVAIAGFEDRAGQIWHLLAEPIEVSGAVRCRVDRDFRFLMQQLHTDLHIVNALVFQAFDGALVTGVQMAADGTARIDFDLPDADNQRIRALKPRINDAIAQDLSVREVCVPYRDAQEDTGLLRSKAVTPPPQADGTIRVIEIAGLDRQACGGTHLTSTGQSRPVRIRKVDNKGRHNRRVRIELVGEDDPR